MVASTLSRHNACAMDDALLRSLGDEAVGVMSAAWYSADHNTPSNKRFVEAMQKDYNVLPGGYAAGTYIAGQCIEAAIQKSGGKTDDRKALAETLHDVSLTDTPRGPLRFDSYGNAVGDVFIQLAALIGEPGLTFFTVLLAALPLAGWRPAAAGAALFAVCQLLLENAWLNPMVIALLLLLPPEDEQSDHHHQQRTTYPIHLDFLRPHYLGESNS